MDLSTILRALPALGPVAAAVPAVKELVDAGIALLAPHDQATAKEAYSDLMADNDEGFARLDAKLAAAEQR